MERTYTFAEKPYRYKVVYIGYLLVAILAFSVFQVATGPSLFWLLPGLIAAYGAANTFLTKSNPREIVVSDESITFRSYGEKTLTVAKLKHFRMRVSAAGYQVYIKAADEAGNKGRFWVNFALFSDKENLLKEFDYLERKTHPDSLRMSGRPNQGKSRPAREAAEQLPC